MVRIRAQAGAADPRCAPSNLALAPRSGAERRLQSLTASDSHAPTSARERNLNLFDGAFGAIYSFYMGHEALGRAIAATVWGGDIRPFFASLAAISQTPAGATIVDAPCGAGNAFRGLSPDQQVRYVAIDLSEGMLERARREAADRDLTQIEFVQGDVTALPIGDREVDLFLSYWALHCLDEPPGALDDAARVLRPEGRLLGATFITGSALRQRLLVHPHRGAFGEVPDEATLSEWLESRFERVEVETSGPFAYFSAQLG
jgi:SAM-dependent methyltransferase